MEILVKAAQLLLSLSILVMVHEMGHFFFARLYKTRVEKFYLFFDPWFSLFKKKVGDTEYGIGWLPLGGYVKISGMIDESMDKEQMKQPPQPYEFRSKKTWQRLLIMLGGIIVNVLFAFLVYSMVLFTWGEEYLPNSEAKYGIMVDSTGTKMGLMNGDKIITVNGTKVDNFRKITSSVIIDKATYFDVERNGVKTKINIPKSIWPELRSNPSFIEVRIPFIIADLAKESAGKDAGLKAGDKIVAYNNQPVQFFDEVRDSLRNSKNKKAVISVLRNKDTLNVSVKIPDSGLLGVAVETNLAKFFTLKKTEYGFFESFPAGVMKTFSMLDFYVKQFKLIFDKDVEGYKSMGGFIAIGKFFPGVWDWFSFWTMTAFLSIILAFMNLLPIPALDGGHVLFLLYEMVTGRKPSDKFLEHAQIVGMVIIFALLIWANGNDIIKLFQ
jgi:regulator of sigma E protease